MGDALLVAILLAVNLGLVTYLLYLRLGGGGAPAGVIRRVVAELWLVFGLATLMLLGVSRLLGTSTARGPGAEAISLAERFRALSGYEQVLAVLGLLVAVLLVVALIRRINRVVDRYAPPPPTGQ